VLTGPLQRPETRIRDELNVGIDESGQESLRRRQSDIPGVIPSGLEADDPVAFHRTVAPWSGNLDWESHLSPTSQARRLAAVGMADSR